MSADNAVVILATERYADERQPGCWTLDGKKRIVYRVATVCALENFEYYQEYQLYNLGAYMQACWGGSKVYKSLDEAKARAQEILEQTGYVEYGIQIKKFQGIFFGDL